MEFSRLASLELACALAGAVWGSGVGLASEEVGFWLHPLAPSFVHGRGGPSRSGGRGYSALLPEKWTLRGPRDQIS